MPTYVENPPIQRAGLTCANSIAEQKVQFDCKSISITKGSEVLASIPLNISLDSDQFSLEEITIPKATTISNPVQIRMTGYDFIAITAYYEKSSSIRTVMMNKGSFTELGTELWESLSYVLIENIEPVYDSMTNLPIERVYKFYNPSNSNVILRILKSNNV